MGNNMLFKKNLNTDLVFMILVGILSLLINIAYFPFGFEPICTMDSGSYISLAQSLNSFCFPNIIQRTISYPLYLCLFNLNMRLAVYFQIIVGALTAAIFYIIVVKIIKYKWISFLVSIFLASDYNLIRFQAEILPETLTAFSLLGLIYSNVLLVTQKINIQKITLSIFFACFLMFLKPTFLILPFVFYAIIFLYYVFVKTTTLLKDIKYLMASMGIIIFAVISWNSINYFQNGFFAFSNIADINILGKMLQYGYLDTDHQYKNAPDLVYKIIDLKTAGYGNSPYTILKELENNPEIRKDSWYNKKLINSYLLKQNCFDFISKTIALIPKVFIAPRVGYYNNPNSIIDRFFDSIDRYKFLVFLLNVIFTVILFILRREEEFITLLFILIAIFCTIVTISMFGYTEYERLKAPIDFLMNFTVVYIFILPFSLCYGLKKRY